MGKGPIFSSDSRDAFQGATQHVKPTESHRFNYCLFRAILFFDVTTPNEILSCFVLPLLNLKIERMHIFYFRSMSKLISLSCLSVAVLLFVDSLAADTIDRLSPPSAKEAKKAHRIHKRMNFAATEDRSKSKEKRPEDADGMPKFLML